MNHDIMFLGNYAEFAIRRGRGPDKRPRKRRLVRNLAITAGGLALAGGLAYGGIKGYRAFKSARSLGKNAGRTRIIPDGATGREAKRAVDSSAKNLRRDIAATKAKYTAEVERLSKKRRLSPLDKQRLKAMQSYLSSY